MRRHVEIFQLFTLRTGHEHPHRKAALENYRRLLAAMGRDEEQQRGEIEALIQSVESQVGL